MTETVFKRLIGAEMSVVHGREEAGNGEVEAVFGVLDAALLLVLVGVVVLLVIRFRKNRSRERSFSKDLRIATRWVRRGDKE